MHFDLRLWRMTVGLRWRIALGVLLGLLALGIGIARFAFLGQFLARLFRSAPAAELVTPLAATLVAILLRAWLDDARTMLAHRTAARVQETLRGRLYDKIVALGPAWFGAERTGGVMLSIVDGVEQLQTFFGQYLPQVTIAAWRRWRSSPSWHGGTSRSRRSCWSRRCSRSGRAGGGARAHQARPRARGRVRSRRSARSSSTPSRVCRR